MAISVNRLIVLGREVVREPRSLVYSLRMTTLRFAQRVVGRVERCHAAVALPSLNVQREARVDGEMTTSMNRRIASASCMPWTVANRVHVPLQPHSSAMDPRAQVPLVPLHLTSLAILSPTNKPLFVHSFTAKSDELRHYHLSHAAVDVIEERSGCLASMEQAIQP